jgi:hypothetical protein
MSKNPHALNSCIPPYVFVCPETFPHLNKYLLLIFNLAPHSWVNLIFMQFTGDRTYCFSSHLRLILPLYLRAVHLSYKLIKNSQVLCIKPTDYTKMSSISIVVFGLQIHDCFRGRKARSHVWILIKRDDYVSTSYWDRNLKAALRLFDI